MAQYKYSQDGTPISPSDPAYATASSAPPGQSVDTSQPSPTDVQQPQGLYKSPTQGVGPDGQPIYDVFGPQGHISGEDPSVFKPGGALYNVNIGNLPTGQAPQGFKSKFEIGFDKANKDLGGNLPDGKGAGVVNSYVGGGKNDFSSSFIKQDEFFSGLVKTFQDFISPANQRTSLRDEYTKMLKDTGIQDIDMELVDMKKVIEGTEDDIRSEITAVGGMGTESQVQALVNSRNKQLIKNYNQLLEVRNSKEKYLNTALQLEQADRQAADERFETAFNMGLQIADYQQKMRKNAIESLDRTIGAVGWGGLSQIVSPYEASLIERAYGLPQGGLRMAAQREQEALNRAEQERQLDLEGKMLGLEETKLGMQLKGEQILTERKQRSLLGQKGVTETDKKLLQAKQNSLNQANVVIGKVDEALGQVGDFNVGLFGGLFSKLPGTSAYNLSQTINTIKSNVGFQALQAMRAASPTGGALGQVAVQELEMLQNTIAALNIGQSRKQLIMNLNEVKQRFENVKATIIAENEGKEIGYDPEGNVIIFD